MKRGFIITMVFSAWCLQVNSQNTIVDSLRQTLVNDQSDSLRASTLALLCQVYKWDHPDSAIFYGEKALALARRSNNLQPELMALDGMSLTHRALGNHVLGLEFGLEGLKKADSAQSLNYMSVFRGMLGSTYFDIGEHTQAINYYREARMFADSARFFEFEVIPIGLTALTYAEMDHLDSALHYGRLANSLADQLEIKWPKTFALEVLGRLFMQTTKYDSAEIKLKERFILPEGSTSLSDLSLNYELLANLYEKMGRFDSCLIYAHKSLDIALETGIYTRIIEANLLLSRLYEKQDESYALKYAKAANIVDGQLDALRIKTSVETYIASNEREQLLEIDRNQMVYENDIQRLWILIISFSLFSILGLGLIIYRNSVQRKKANRKLKEKNEEVEKTLDRLQSTQTQLIHSEKMASLGELTAGIAHEIQNPLNFVNNFSEVNREMLHELKEAVAKNDQEEINGILKDLDENEEKITHHGKRAEGIVKSMLQHSRTGSDEKELTDINALCDEYLRLAYHGFRAKDKSFNSEFELDLDESLPKINVVPQDIGRVLLNLINNAFQAVSSHPNLPAGRQGQVEGDEEGTLRQAQSDFKPKVIVSTKSIPLLGGARGGLQITVSDNGPGIPYNIKNKIFEPFFTTKPTGEGTGLGLSMSYDIVTKGHGGELKVESLEGKGTEFIVTIPV